MKKIIIILFSIPLLVFSQPSQPGYNITVNTGDAWHGNLFFQRGGNSPRPVKILDHSGVQLFSQNWGMKGWDFKVNYNNKLSYFDRLSKGWFIMDSLQNIVDSVYCQNGYIADNHDFLALPNGNYVLFAYDEQPYAMDTVVAGGDPNATVEVVWTFTWFGPEAETQAANALLETGADVLTQHQDSTATGIAAEAAGAKWISYNTAYGKDAAPEAFVTAPVWDWGPYYVSVVESIADGSFVPEAYWGGMETGLVSLYELSGDVPRTVEQLVNERTMEILSGAFDPPIVEDKFVDNVIGTVSP